MRLNQHWYRYVCGIFLLMFIVLVPFIRPFNDYLAVPNEMIAFKSDLKLPEINTLMKADLSVPVTNEAYDQVTVEQPVIYDFHGFPIKKIDLALLADYYVVPGGHSLGIQLQTLGVLVVGHHLIKKDDEYFSPGEDAKIDVGDIIIKINESDVKQMDDVSQMIEQYSKEDQPLTVTIKRGDAEMTRTLQPIYDAKEDKYQIGLYIRDSTSGIGTMTFYDPNNYKYGALGHVISDIDTKKPVEIYDGSIVRSTVNSITKGEHGRPGEKKATIHNHRKSLGTITKNTPFGIFGQLTDPSITNQQHETIPIALAHEIVEGPAEILTVVDGEDVESFDVEVISSSPQQIPSTKGMIIKITDPKLLEKTGGIVQGMSGSPIIQNGKLIGAVTHVFVNEPNSGYGIHIEWMLQEAGIDIFGTKDKAS